MKSAEVKTFEEKARAIIKSLKESFDQSELLELAKEISGPENIDDIYVNSIKEPDTLAIDTDNELPTDEIELPTNNTVPFEKAPKFRIYWRAWKEGNNSSGQTESNLETAQMARAEAMTKLYDLGFNDIEVLAIETIENTNLSI